MSLLYVAAEILNALNTKSVSVKTAVYSSSYEVKRDKKKIESDFAPVQLGATLQ